jgi:hypothetical protein
MVFEEGLIVNGTQLSRDRKRYYSLTWSILCALVTINYYLLVVIEELRVNIKTR